VEVLITILREVRDPRDFNARHDCASMLFIALIATLCGAKSCVGYADFAAAHVEELAEVVDLPYGAPSHDSFWRKVCGILLKPCAKASAWDRSRA
jgi:hypothetical protein